ncbi:MAG TPA: hypothetical protein VHB21_13815, partial [Minicystis sp.]|nr:hypothetical protein [Minicystis sp.]
TMTLAGDRAHASPRPERWDARGLVARAFGVSMPWLAFLVGSFVVARRAAHLSDDAAQTFAFLALVYAGQANVYIVRARGHLFHARPGTSTLVASIVTCAAASALAMLGVLMQPLAPRVVLALLGAEVAFTLALDAAKVRLFPPVPGAGLTPPG